MDRKTSNYDVNISYLLLLKLFLTIKLTNWLLNIIYL